MYMTNTLDCEPVDAGLVVGFFFWFPGFVSLIEVVEDTREILYDGQA